MRAFRVSSLVFFSALCSVFTITYGKVVFITGASSGIGRQVALDLAGEGHQIFVTARREAALKSLVEEIKGGGGSAEYYISDVANEEQLAASFDAAEKAFGGIDFVFANAGIEGNSPSKPLDASSEEDIRHVFNVNLIGSGFMTLKYATAALKKRGGGSIAISSSIVSFLNQQSMSVMRSVNPGVSFVLPYAVSKVALDGLVRMAAGVYGADNINIYGLNIGVFASEMTERATKNMGRQPTGFNPYFKTSMGNPADISKVISAIIDGSTKYKSGDGIVIDNDSTMNVKSYYDIMYENGSPQSFGWYSPEDTGKLMKDLKGDMPYDFSSKEKEL